ncbi:MAG: MOSC domain-containing protein [Gemmataceae bacterium]|nr:MOSC domain-containing protein [Gemmataceae bacterium]
MTGRVVSIVYTPAEVEVRKPPDRYARVPVGRATLAEGRGIVGDLKNSVGRRQLNVMCAEALAELAAEGFKAGPGELGEQVVLSGIPRDALVAGTRVRLGGAVMEVVEPRTGCARFEAIQVKPRAAAAGRLGVMARVVAGGEVAVGDTAEVLPG